MCNLVTNANLPQTGCVGKTSLVLRYVSDVFNNSHQSTLQASFLKKTIYLDQDLVRLNIWDTVSSNELARLSPKVIDSNNV